MHLPSSLHYQNPLQPNAYIQVLQSIGGIISYYDTDKMFPSFGFGGKFQDGSVSHDFALVRPLPWLLGCLVGWLVAQF